MSAHKPRRHPQNIRMLSGQPQLGEVENKARVPGNGEPAFNLEELVAYGAQLIVNPETGEITQVILPPGLMDRLRATGNSSEIE